MRNKFNLIVLVAISLTSCLKQQSNNANDMTVNCEISKDSKELVYYVNNDSDSSVFVLLLASETLPEVYSKSIYDSNYKNITFEFYLSTWSLKDSSIIFNPKNEKEFDFLPDKNKPETTSFFDKVITKIKESKLSLKSDKLSDFNSFMDNSVFFRPGEYYCDTIPIADYIKSSPDEDIKFVFT